MIDVWGLKNCDTCRSARRWLEAHGIDFAFHDVRNEPPGQARLTHWLKSVGSDVLVNRRGTTWRNLDARAKQRFADNDIIPVLVEFPALMKRPIVENGKRVIVGFDAAGFQELLGSSK